MAITQKDIAGAHERIRPYIHRTPVLTSQALDRLAGASLYFKCENFQKIGAFKIRGGMNAALSLSPAEVEKGLATHSSGNHAQAIAYAARTLGVPAYIVMPNNSPAVKVAAVQGYGAEVIFCVPTQAAREQTLAEVLHRTGAAFVHPYDNDFVIAGQATCAKELLEDVSDLDTLIAPVGGGGLMSGTCLAAHFWRPGVAVYAGEPEGAGDAVLSLKSGKVEQAPYVNTIADGLRTTLSERTLSILQQHLREVVLVSDVDIVQAMRWVYERLKIVIEPSSAVPFAAVLKRPDVFADRKIGIILTGGNVDLRSLTDFFGEKSA